MLQHHRCASQLSPPRLYEELGRSHCNEILNEQNAIRSLAMGLGKYKDLYLEQGEWEGGRGVTKLINPLNDDK